jgi:parallel beta-helix repeat protein
MPNLVSGAVLLNAKDVGLECDAYNPVIGHYDNDGIHLMKYNILKKHCDVKDFQYGLYRRMNKELLERAGFEGNTIYIGGSEDNCIDYGEWIDSICVLSQDLGDTVVINANNIGLDCNGHSIIGYHTLGSTGISIYNKNNIIVENCIVSEFEYGFFIKNSFDVNITNNTASYNFYESAGPTRSGWGLYLDSVHDGTFSDNKVHHNRNGFGVYALETDLYHNNFSNNELEYNEFYFDNGGNGFYIYFAHDNKFLNNTIYHHVNGFYSLGGFYNTFLDNEITLHNRAFYIWSMAADSHYNIITGNKIQKGYYGIFIDKSADNSIYDNYFSEFTINAFATTNNDWHIMKTKGTNIIGGPYIGGNFWDDYTGEDTTGDSIGDTEIPYNSSENITIGGDYLPLVPDIVPPIISIISPENRTYTTNSLDLTFTINEEPSWIGYSLDYQLNITITNNITLVNLDGGTHNVIIYANDTSGNMDSSDKVYFSIDTPPSYIIWGLDKTLIHRGESLNAYAKWDEDIESAYVETNISSESLLNETVSVGSPWTNATLTHDLHGTLGNKTARIFAQDLGGNWNETTIKNFQVYGWAGSKIYLETFKDRGKDYIKISCLVEDVNLLSPLSSYYTEIIYNEADVLASNYTHDNGWFNHTELLQDGIYKCAIYDNETRFYHALSNGTHEYPDVTPPLINILKPKNGNVYYATSIDLTFTVNEETSWMGYSLDGNENVTVTGNTTLNDLSIGSHDVIVFASDTSENMGSSDTIYFEVSEGGTPPGGIGGGGTPMFEITYV